MTHYAPRYPNQGTQVVAGWNHASTLRNWTAYTGTDGEVFLPPNDRDGSLGAGYTAGVIRRPPTGGILYAGRPVTRLVFPWFTNGQIAYLQNTMLGGNPSGNVTASIHIPTSTGVLVLTNVNAVMNVDSNQVSTLARAHTGYKGFVVELVIVEVL